MDLLGLSPAISLLIVVVALLTGVLHGATGMAGGIVMTAILSHILGIKEAVPVMTCALIISHSSRIFLYWRETDWSICKRVLLFGSPTILLGAYIFSFLSPRVIAIIFTLFLISSLHFKYWTRKHKIDAGPKTLAIASSIWGMLAGNVVGPGFFLAPFMLATGISRLAFAGSIAVITLVMNLLKLSVFGATDLMNPRLFILGVVIGVMTIPGNWLGSHFLRSIRDRQHSIIMDVMTLMVIANFIYLAIF